MCAKALLGDPIPMPLVESLNPEAISTISVSYTFKCLIGALFNSTLIYLMEMSFHFRRYHLTSKNSWKDFSLMEVIVQIMPT